MTAPTPEDIVRSFYEDWDTEGFRKSYEKHLHPEVTVQNTGFPDWHGKEYVRQGVAEYERKVREQVERSLRRKAAALGYQLVPKPAAGAAPA